MNFSPQAGHKQAEKPDDGEFRESLDLYLK